MSDATTAPAAPEWVSAAQARVILGISEGRWSRLARLRPFATRRLAGGSPQYKRTDLVAFAERSIQPAAELAPSF